VGNFSEVLVIVGSNVIQTAKFQPIHPAKVDTAHRQKHRKSPFQGPAAFITKVSKGLNKPNTSGNFWG
jgi:hypothetical protein